MKKIILSISIILFSLSGFGQALKPVKIDSLVTVSLPTGFTKKDTLGQQIYQGTGSLGNILVLRVPNPPNAKPLNKEKDLKNVFKTYISGIQKQSVNGSVMYPRDTTIGKLEGKVFTLRIDNSGSTGESPELRNFILLYTQDVTYTFEYNYPEQRADLAKAELKQFSSSIRIAPTLDRRDQYLSDAKGLSSPAKIGIYGGGAIIVFIIVFTVMRRKNRQLEAGV
ncbi:hypothetical protein [Mucilaginibacter celer]|uniref:Uncharacterized protein n=1 Tax=Mucilaginibacter celer TaxID=2305508 RepID=A0A494VQF0_9SPHI|nr:hypothetical protein [Mucilaginibacter celer]AYL97074.1 hypothetical protein HYN43_017945 [Mucilaginibacter celer]